MPPQNVHTEININLITYVCNMILTTWSVWQLNIAHTQTTLILRSKTHALNPINIQPTKPSTLNVRRAMESHKIQKRDTLILTRNYKTLVLEMSLATFTAIKWPIQNNEFPFDNMVISMFALALDPLSWLSPSGTLSWVTEHDYSTGKWMT